MRSHHDKIRKCLQDHPDGRTVAELVECTSISADVLRQTLETCFGVYVDRWEGPRRGQWAAVWCVASVPENCPRPE